MPGLGFGGKRGIMGTVLVRHAVATFSFAYQEFYFMRPATTLIFALLLTASLIDAAVAANEDINLGRVQSFDGKRYRVRAALDDAVKSVELLDGAKAAAAINAWLAKELNEQISAWYGCPTESEQESARQSQNGEPQAGTRKKDEKPVYSASVEILFWNDKWISFASRSQGDCGGAHPFSGFSYSTWDLATGKAVNLWRWIKNSKKPDGLPEYDGHYINYVAPAALNKIITRRAVKQRLAFNPKEASEGNNCLASIRENSEYKIRLSLRGLVFTQSFPHVILACTDNIEVSYRELAPFLSAQGKAAVAALSN
jgi:hypothetical protein